jgi:hypothetical protein
MNKQKREIGIVSKVLALYLLDKYPELSMNMFFEAMSKNINFRDEVLSYLDSKFILKEEKI